MNIPLNVNLQQIFLHLLNFTALFAILYFLLYSPVKKFMESREEYFKEKEAEALKNLEESKRVQDEYIRKLENADSEIAELKEKALKDADSICRLKIEQSEKDAEKLISDARAQSEREHKKMLADAKNELSGIVTSAVQRIALSNDTSASYDEFLNAVKRSEGDE